MSTPALCMSSFAQLQRTKLYRLERGGKKIMARRFLISKVGSRTPKINKAVLLVAATTKDSSKKKTG
ncbi:hypothetical protein HRG84_08835 [Flavisolibacter sp. BT320]|nr:hypothetical protein [Flavisolibacter longurius]